MSGSDSPNMHVTCGVFISSAKGKPPRSNFTLFMCAFCCPSYPQKCSEQIEVEDHEGEEITSHRAIAYERLRVRKQVFVRDYVTVMGK